VGNQRSVGIVRSRTKATVFVFVLWKNQVLHLQGKLCFYQTSIPTCKAIRCHRLEDHNIIHFSCWWNSMLFWTPVTISWDWTLFEEYIFSIDHSMCEWVSFFQLCLRLPQDEPKFNIHSKEFYSAQLKKKKLSWRNFLFVQQYSMKVPPPFATNYGCSLYYFILHYMFRPISRPSSGAIWQITKR
jgi:hypothetical protein